ISLHHLLAGNGIDLIHRAAIRRLCFVVALHCFVISALRVEKLHQRRSAGTIGISHRISRLLGGLQQLAFDVLQKLTAVFELLVASFDIRKNISLQRAQLPSDLFLLGSDASDLPLISVQYWKGHAEKEPERVVLSIDSLIAPILGTYQKVRLALRYLQLEITLRQGLRAIQNLEVRPEGQCGIFEIGQIDSSWLRLK